MKKEPNTICLPRLLTTALLTCSLSLNVMAQQQIVTVNLHNVTLAHAIKTIGKGSSLQRYKGLGEMNPEQLWETTMNPENRTLIRVNIEDAADVEHLVTLLMGDKVGPRKEYISEYANFNKVDSFEEKARRPKDEGSAQ